MAGVKSCASRILGRAVPGNRGEGYRLGRVDAGMRFSCLAGSRTVSVVLWHYRECCVDSVFGEAGQEKKGDKICPSVQCPLGPRITLIAAQHFQVGQEWAPGRFPGTGHQHPRHGRQ